MSKGIAILGLNGGGKSTLAHALAKEINYYEMDAEDYYFPEQKASRQSSLDKQYDIVCNYLGELPYSVPREKKVVEQAIYEEIQLHPNFILAGVTMNWSEKILSNLFIAFWIRTPIEERIKRIKEREEKRFGLRVVEGGDMYEQQLEFLKNVANCSETEVEESVKKLSCKVVVLDGTNPTSKNVEIMLNSTGWK